MAYFELMLVACAKLTAMRYAAPMVIALTSQRLWHALSRWRWLALKPTATAHTSQLHALRCRKYHTERIAIAHAEPLAIAH